MLLFLLVLLVLLILLFGLVLFVLFVLLVFLVLLFLLQSNVSQMAALTSKSTFAAKPYLAFVRSVRHSSEFAQVGRILIVAGFDLLLEFGFGLFAGLFVLVLQPFFVG